MTFSSDIKNFTSKAISQIEALQVAQKERIAAFLQELLGDDANTIKRIEFDNELHKFFNVEAPESVICKLREAGHLRE